MHEGWRTERRVDRKAGRKADLSGRHKKQAYKYVCPGLLDEKEPIIRKRLPGRKGGRQSGLCKRKASKRAFRQADRYVSMSGCLATVAKVLGSISASILCHSGI